MTRQRWGIVVASAPEAAVLVHAIHTQQQAVEPMGRWWVGQWQGQEVILVRCGMGPQRAAQALAWLTQHHQLLGVFSTGFAGALHAQCATGDGILATHVRPYPESDRLQTGPIMPDAHLLHVALAAAMQAGLTVHRGPLVSTAGVIEQAAAKQRLGEVSGALAVDMESYSIGQIAARYNLPFLVLRTIFDTVAEDCAIPPAICTTPEGALRPYRFLTYMVTHPRACIQLPRVWWQARQAGHHLQSWLQHFFSLLG